jgi:hypothetical protein
VPNDKHRLGVDRAIGEPAQNVSILCVFHLLQCVRHRQPCELVDFSVRREFAADAAGSPIPNLLDALVDRIAHFGDSTTEVHPITGFLKNFAHGGHRLGFPRIKFALRQ